MASVISQLKNAGVRVPPLNQRVWNWLKDNGEHTTREISAAIKVSLSSVSSTCTTMRDRDMLLSKSEHSKASNRNLLYYRVSPKMRSYVLLPISLAGKARVKRGQATPAIKPPEVLSAPAKPQFDAKTALDNLTAREAHSLFQEMKKIFEKDMSNLT